jgi:hypothetical protein
MMWGSDRVPSANCVTPFQAPPLRRVISFRKYQLTRSGFSEECRLKGRSWFWGSEYPFCRVPQMELSLPTQGTFSCPGSWCVGRGREVVNRKPGVQPPLHNSFDLQTFVKAKRNQSCLCFLLGPGQPGAPCGDLVAKVAPFSAVEEAWIA